MKVVPFALALFTFAQVSQAQQGRPPKPPVPPASQAPIVRPAPLPPANSYSLFDFQELETQLEKLRFNQAPWARLFDAREFQLRIPEFQQEALFAAERALAFQDRAWAPMHDFDFNFDEMRSEGFAQQSALIKEWGQPDPADSLYRVAYEAMNRGDWRRAADLFARVQRDYPKSNRLIAAAYYEAFNNYRIGSLESLRTALRILNERTSGARESSTQAEIASLKTRVRGALAARGDRDAQQALASDAQRGTTCDREDMQVRTEALSALAQADMESATPMLMQVLERRDQCSLDLRRRALSILLRRGDTAATTAAIRVARNADEHTNMRTDAISYLSRLPGESAIVTLQELLRTSDDATIQRAAVRSLSRSDNARARQAVRTIIERSDVSEALRAEAISSIDASNADEATYLRGLYSRLGAERLRTATISALARGGGEENERFVLGIARNSSEPSEVRSVAISRLARSSNVPLTDWQSLYDSAESRSVRSRIISVYSQRKEPETVDRLIAIARNGTDPSLRSQAVSALRSKAKDDPRAHKFLQDLINR